MFDLAINLWTQLFGLYPMPLNPQGEDNKYLMLNGGSNDFCLQMRPDTQDIPTYFSDSWSSNTKNFITITDATILIYNWYNNKKIEPYPLKNIDAGLYNYLTSKSYKTQDDVVPFIINVFRRLRNMTGKKEPVEALNLLFKLLISIKEDTFDTQLWGIKDVSISSANFESFVAQIRNGVNNINPNLDLILRHTSGALFQEAQKEIIYFDNQMDLWSGYSSKLKTKNNIYSSVHYTPQYLSRSIVENCLKQLNLNKTELKIFDPACGSSEFLIETLKQLQNQNYKGKIKIIGWDSSESAVCTSNFLLKYEQRTQWKNNQLAFEIKQVVDSLTEHWDNDYDLILMNPPYISWELLTDKNSKDAIMETLSAFKISKPNQASAFFYKAAKSLNQNGVLGCVIPTSILTSDSYKKIRNEIKEEFTINLLAKLGNYVFESALTDVSFFVGKKNKSNIFPELIWTKNEKGAVQDVLCDLRKKEFNNSPAVENKSYSIYTPSKFPIITDGWKVISSKEERFLKDVQRYEVEKILVKVSDVFNVKQGVRTGNNNVFKLSEEVFKRMPTIEQKYFKSVIDNDAINNGQLNTVTYVWYPYNSINGQSLILDENWLITELPYFYENHLKPNKIGLSNRRKIIPNWWDLSDKAPRLLPIEKSIVSTEFGNSNSFSINNDIETIVERGYMWVSKTKFKETDYYFYLAVFSSNIFDFLLSIYSKQLAGGNWYDLGAKYTKNIPIPNIFSSDVKNLNQYQRLVELGKEFVNGNSYVKYAIDDALESFYPKIN